MNHNEIAELILDAARAYTHDTVAIHHDGYMDGICAYGLPDGRRCAVGRLLIRMPRWVMEIEGGVTELVETTRERGLPLHSIFPKRIATWLEEDPDHAVAVLGDIQRLHDNPLHWDGTGLSGPGWRAVNHLLRQHAHTWTARS